jgi:hypothetical protein
LPHAQLLEVLHTRTMACGRSPRGSISRTSGDSVATRYAVDRFTPVSVSRHEFPSRVTPWLYPIFTARNTLRWRLGRRPSAERAEPTFRRCSYNSRSSFCPSADAGAERRSCA